MHKGRALLIICLAAFLLRMLLAAQAPTLTYDAYATVRQVQHITDTGLPLIHDTLSYGGRTLIPLPVYPYILSFGSLFMPDDLAFILIPNVFAVLLHAALFYLILELTNNENLALLGAAASIFIPSYVSATLLTLSSLSLALPLLILLVTLFLKLRKSKEHRNTLLLLFIVLCFTHPIALLCIPFFIVTVVLSTIQHAKDDVAQREFGLFAIFFVLWLYVLLYKDSLSTIGIATIQGNMPSAVLETVYADIHIITLATAIGVIPFGLSLYAAYREALAQHIGIQATLALGISVAAALMLKAIPLTIGLALFSAVCIALAAVGLQQFALYSKGFKRRGVARGVYIIIGILFIATSVLPTFTTGVQTTQQTAPRSLLNAAHWIAQNTPKDALIVSEPEWGHILAAYAQRAVYVDTLYIDRTDAEERYTTARSILLSAQPSSLAKAEHIDYIVSDTPLSDRCLNTVYREDIYITKVLCK